MAKQKHQRATVRRRDSEVQAALRNSSTPILQMIAHELAAFRQQLETNLAHRPMSQPTRSSNGNSAEASGSRVDPSAFTEVQD